MTGLSSALVVHRASATARRRCDGVGIGHAEPREDRGLARLHRARVAGGVVVVALQVQHAVDDEVRAVIGERLALRLRLVAHDRRAQHDVAFDPRRFSSYTNASTLVAYSLPR